MSAAKFFLLCGSANALLSVLFGAFGAHGLKKIATPELLNAYQTGAQYHFYHALGLLAIGLFATQYEQATPSLLNWAGWLMLLGIILFCGSLYLLTITGITRLGIITPIGGFAFLIAWLLFFIAIWQAT